MMNLDLNYLINMEINQIKYKKVDSERPNIELYDKNKNKLDGTFKKIIDDNPNSEIFDKKGNKLHKNFRKVLSDIPEEQLSWRVKQKKNPSRWFILGIKRKRRLSSMG